MKHGLLTVRELRDLEMMASRGLAAGTLMRRAGQTAAQWLDKKLPARSSICVVAGPGNNGGDGFTTATALQALGHSVQVFVPASEPAGDEAAGAVAQWRAVGGTVVADARFAEFDALVDAMFGIGGTRPLSSAFLAAAEAMSNSGRPVYSLDVPSGLDADRGSWLGDVVGVRATATLTFLADKPGLHTGDGREASGNVDVATLDAETPASSIALAQPGDFSGICKPRALNTHKGSFGSLDVIGGGEGMVGAVLLAARAGLRLGAGRVYVRAVGATGLGVDPIAPELMFRNGANRPNVAASVIGCGLGAGAEGHAALREALGADHPLVIDADALNLIAADASLQPLVGTRHAATVLTPHPLEAARLLGVSAASVQHDRIEAARELARRYRSIVVLKGAGTVVATTQHLWINPTGGPALATAGTGDVLAGMIGALLAQGFDATECAVAAVWLHGRAADRYGADIGLTASDIAPFAVAELAALRRR